MVQPLITIAVQCHRFQRRLCWMLSSLAQQTAPVIKVDIAFIPGEGDPTTEQIADLFPRLEIRRSAWLDFDRFQLRGLVRNRQLHECDTEWLMFGDCDMVYHPDYFERLLALLSSEHRDARYMLSSGRTSNPKEQANAMVDSCDWRKPNEIKKAFSLANSLPKVPMRNVGAGFCQVINFRFAPHDCYYVRPNENRDWSWARGSNPKSDMQFRRRIAEKGGERRSLPQWFSDNAIHLNHDRDPEAGHHLEHQR